MSRVRKDVGSLLNVVLVDRKHVPPTFSFTHWLLPVLDRNDALRMGFSSTVPIATREYTRFPGDCAEYKYLLWNNSLGSIGPSAHNKTAKQGGNYIAKWQSKTSE